MNKLEQRVHDLSVSCAYMLNSKHCGYEDWNELEFMAVRYDLAEALKELELYNIKKEAKKCKLWWHIFRNLFYELLEDKIIYHSTDDFSFTLESSDYYKQEDFYGAIIAGEIVPVVGEYDD